MTRPSLSLVFVFSLFFLLFTVVVFIVTAKTRETFQTTMDGGAAVKAEARRRAYERHQMQALQAIASASRNKASKAHVEKAHAHVRARADAQHAAARTDVLASKEAILESCFSQSNALPFATRARLASALQTHPLRDDVNYALRQRLVTQADLETQRRTQAARLASRDQVVALSNLVEGTYQQRNALLDEQQALETQTLPTFHRTIAADQARIVNVGNDLQAMRDDLQGILQNQLKTWGTQDGPLLQQGYLDLRAQASNVLQTKSAFEQRLKDTDLAEDELLTIMTDVQDNTLPSLAKKRQGIYDAVKPGLDDALETSQGVRDAYSFDATRPQVVVNYNSKMHPRTNHAGYVRDVGFVLATVEGSPEAAADEHASIVMEGWVGGTMAPPRDAADIRLFFTFKEQSGALLRPPTVEVKAGSDWRTVFDVCVYRDPNTLTSTLALVIFGNPAMLSHAFNLNVFASGTRVRVYNTVQQAPVWPPTEQEGVFSLAGKFPGLPPVQMREDGLPGGGVDTGDAEAVTKVSGIVGLQTSTLLTDDDAPLLRLKKKQQGARELHVVQDVGLFNNGDIQLRNNADGTRAKLSFLSGGNNVAANIEESVVGEEEEEVLLVNASPEVVLRAPRMEMRDRMRVVDGDLTVGYEDQGGVHLKGDSIQWSVGRMTYKGQPVVNPGTKGVTSMEKGPKGRKRKKRIVGVVKGIPGIQGDHGARGPKGDRGQTGEPGQRGEKGAEGIRGPNGPSGNYTNFYKQDQYPPSKRGNRGKEGVGPTDLPIFYGLFDPSQMATRFKAPIIWPNSGDVILEGNRLQGDLHGTNIHIIDNEGLRFGNGYRLYPIHAHGAPGVVLEKNNKRIACQPPIACKGLNLDLSPLALPLTVSKTLITHTTSPKSAIVQFGNALKKFFR
jgi:hypothetical protein